MVLTPERILALKGAADALASAPHGGKGAVAQAEAARLGCDTATLYRQLAEAGLARPRKRRTDAGRCAVSREEAQKVMTLKAMAQRANGKDILSIANAGELARANGLCALGRVDAETGELTPVNPATLARAIRHYRLDIGTLRQPRPHRAMRSLHPNHVWQIDASVCVLYYLDTGGLGVMEHDEFYKNKPENFAKKINATVIRYVCTDHYSGAFHFRYYLGSESGDMLCNFFLDCIGRKAHDKEPFHGVPFIVVVDPGSANKGAMFANLLRLLGVKLIVHAPKNPRAKGSVEKHNDIIERGFEARLGCVRIGSLEQLNAEGSVWRRYYNGTQAHSRHGMPRYVMWQRIRREQLRLAPPIEVCRALMTRRPETREVRGDLTVSFGGRIYSVRNVPHLNVGQKVMVAQSPYRDDAILLIERDAQERDVHWVCPEVAFTDGGFRADAPVWGENYKGVVDTPAVRDMKTIETLAYGVEGKLAVDAARRKRTPVFGGLDITGYLDKQTPLSYLPRAGTEMDVASPVQNGASGDSLNAPDTVAVETTPLSPMQMASRLHALMQDAWRPEYYASISSWYPNGAAESELPAIADRLSRHAPLRLIAAGGQ